MDYFVDSPLPKTPSLLDKASALYDENAPRAFGALATALTTVQLVGDFQDRDIGAFVKHAAEAAISTNPIGAAGVTAFEFGNSVVRDVRAGDTGKAVKDAVEGAAITRGSVFGVPGLLISRAIVGATELGYRLLGHSHPNKPPSESIGGSVTISVRCMPNRLVVKQTLSVLGVH